MNLPNRDGLPPGSPNFLIVEDHAAMREAVRRFVAAAYPTSVIALASTGAQALVEMGAMRPDLVLMDVHLPDANGIELTVQIKAVSDTTQVVILTQSAGLAYEAHAKLVGAFGYVHKEMIFTDLISMVERALAQRDGHRRGDAAPA